MGTNQIIRTYETCAKNEITPFQIYNLSVSSLWKNIGFKAENHDTLLKNKIVFVTHTLMFKLWCFDKQWRTESSVASVTHS